VGNPVYLNKAQFAAEASFIKNDPLFAVGFSDKRVAKIAIKIVNSISLSGGTDLAEKILISAATFRVLPEHLKKPTKVAKKAVCLIENEDGGFSVIPPDNIYSSALRIAFYRSRLEAEVIYHLVSTLSENQYQVSDAILRSIEIGA